MTSTIDKINVAVIQHQWLSTPQQNLDSILRKIDTICTSEDVQLIILPEFFMGAPWFFPGRAAFKGQLEYTIPGELIDVFAKKAKQYNTFILVGSLVEKCNNKYYATSTLLNDEGEIIGKARKIHLYASEMANIEPGEEIVVCDTKIGRIGICICADFWIQEMPRMLALSGAEIICIPGASLLQNINITKPCVLANSVHNVCYTLYSSIVGNVEGQRNGRDVVIEMGGHSTIAEPGGIIASMNEDDDGFIIEKLSLSRIRELRTVDSNFNRTLFWCLQGRKPHLYKPIMTAFRPIKITWK